ncbi:MAG: hypothetical protein WCT47_18700 [Betaproteobacteria bacterium]
MTPLSPDFPEPFSEVLIQLQEVLGLLRESAASMLAAGPSLAEQEASAGGADVEAPADEGLAGLAAVEAPMRACAHALRDCGRAPLALLVEGCVGALAGLLASPARHGPDAHRVIEQALQAGLRQAEHPGGDAFAVATELFPHYRAVHQLAGIDRVHPADLWPGRHTLVDLPADPFTAPRILDAAARVELEAALLETLRQPGPQGFRAMSDLCAALGEGVAAPQAGLWKLAAAAYEAQADELLAPDVYLKRMGPRLLSLARTALADAPYTGAGLAEAGAPGAAPASPRAQGAAQVRANAQESARQLGHELLFRCHSALAACAGPGAAAAGPRLARFAAAYGLPYHPAPAPTLQAAAARERDVSAPAGPGAEQGLVLQPGAIDDSVAPAATAGAAASRSDAQPEEPAFELLLPPEPASSALGPAPARRSLADAVPGLPSAADLDLGGWGLAANADRVVTPDDEIKVVGSLRLEIPVFNAFLNDADEASRRLSMVLAEWADAAALPVPSEAAVQAFALAQGADRVGHEALAALSHLLVQVLRACSTPPGPAAVVAAPAWAAQTLTAAAEEVRRVLHQFAAGFLTEPSAACVARLGQCLADPPSPSLGLLPGAGDSPAASEDAAGSSAVPLSEAGELRSLHDLASLRDSLASALDRLALSRPSEAAAASDLAAADRRFGDAWSEASDRLAATEDLIRSLLERPRPPEA